MDSISTTHGNGEAGLPDSAAGELEALLAATEQAAEQAGYWSGLFSDALAGELRMTGGAS